MTDETPTIRLPEIRKATDDEISTLVRQLIAGDWLPQLETDYLSALTARAPLRLRQPLYDEVVRRNPAAVNRTPQEALPPVPKVWDPYEADEWTPIHDSWLETMLLMVERFENFDPRDRKHQRSDDRYNKEMGKPEPRDEFRFIRKEIGLSLEDVGRMIGQDKSVVSRWESGRRPCDDRDYFEWLSAAAAELADEAALRVFQACLLRDGWHEHDGLTMGDAHKHLWPAIFKETGTFSRWRRTGTLPPFTPHDAGLVAA